VRAARLSGPGASATEERVMTQPVRTLTVGELPVEVHPDSAALGARGAALAAAGLVRAVAERGSARMIAATGNSQFDLVAALARQDVPWEQVTVFHMDEYVGLAADHPASFQRWIRERIEDTLHPRHVEYIRGDATDVAAECTRYEAALRSAPIDVVLLGIGENGHLAFNEPFAADFEDRQWVREIVLDPVSRRQQVGEGHFPDVDSVPRTAISLTVPALLAPDVLVVSVPERRKADAVRLALTGPVDTSCPASILRTTPKATLLLDEESASQLRS
jgi:glucosamine-6-phosphate deaminase